MNRGGVGIGGGADGGDGPTSATAKNQKSLLERVDTDVENLVANFGFIVNVAQVNEPPVRNSQESFMMELRAARMTAIFSGFASLDDHVEQRTEEFDKLEENTNGTLARIGEEAAASLKELESYYYTTLRTSISH